MDDIIESAEATAIIDVALVAVYVDDFPRALAFYQDILGLKKVFEMGEKSYYFNIGGNSGLYLEGGNTPTDVDVKTARSSFVLQVKSAGAMFGKLTGAGVRIIQQQPVDMGGDSFWFQFYDPCGNILEIVGGE